MSHPPDQYLGYHPPGTRAHFYFIDLVDGERQRKVVADTVRVAELLGVDKIVPMSGLPSRGPNERRPNWVTCAWPLENGEILDWQWNENKEESE